MTDSKWVVMYRGLQRTHCVLQIQAKEVIFLSHIYGSHLNGAAIVGLTERDPPWNWDSE